MNKLQVFNNPEFGEIRIIDIEGEPWWVLADVCRALNIERTDSAARRLDSDEKGTHLVSTPGGTQNMTIINESGLYKVLLRSDKPEAKKFTRWVTSEVLPSIRKHGGYLAKQEELSPEELMAKALAVAQQILAKREERIKFQATEISSLKAYNQVMKPKADYFDELVDRNLLMSFRETAKQLNIKEKVFIQFLLDEKYIYRDQKRKLMPYSDYNDDLFRIKECFSEKTKWSGTQTMVTPKGMETFRLLLKDSIKNK